MLSLQFSQMSNQEPVQPLGALQCQCTDNSLVLFTKLALIVTGPAALKGQGGDSPAKVGVTPRLALWTSILSVSKPEYYNKITYRRLVKRQRT